MLAEPDASLDIAPLLDKLRAEPVERVLGWLNGLTDFRFSAYAVPMAGRFETLLHHDRLGMSARLAPMPATGSYFEEALIHNGFAVSNSLRDERLTDNPWRKLIRAFHGVPAALPDGRVIGVLCHYDVLPCQLPEADSRLLRQIADHLALRLPPPG